ncbi:MAG: hypothetical protein ACOCWM_03830 [Cyclobacteriaceae bacterium]
MKKNFQLLVLAILISGCDKNVNDVEIVNCETDNSIDVVTSRSFNMGFSTWPYGPDESDKTETYQFIEQHADIYSEQIDDKIPWNSLINNTSLPSEFENDIDFRQRKKIDNHKLLLSVSLLNSDRSDLLEDYDGSIPNYSALNDKIIENAYYKHLEYLIAAFSPDYLVFAMEVNDLKLKSEQKWIEYKLLAENIRLRLNSDYPSLQISESVTLHNFYNPEVSNPNDYIDELSDYINTNSDFAAISFYPFFKGLHTKSEFQQAFDFLHGQINIPIAFVETTHIAETLQIPSIDLSIPSDICEQKDYLELILLNAYNNNYKFIIWWAYRDFDELWETFPDEYQDLGKLWRDTGLLNEDEEERPSYNIWQIVYNLKK